MKDVDLTNNEIFGKHAVEISEAFQKAEEALKALELLGEGIAFPSVNQLRYVAHHLIRALCQDMEIHLAALKAIAKKWNLARPELNKKLIAERKDNRRFIVTFLLSAAALVASIVFGVLTL